MVVLMIETIGIQKYWKYLQPEDKKLQSKIDSIQYIVF